MLATQRLLFGLKRLLLKPELSLPVVLSLGCTLAAVLTVLTIFHALIIRPLPHISNPEQLSLHNLQLQMGPVQVNAFTRPIFAHFRQYMQSYGDWAYLEVSNQQPVEVAQQQHQLTHMQASAGSAEILGLRLLRGDSAQQADGTDSVWISETTWHQLYQGDLAIVGKALNYQGKAYKIAGVYQDLLAFPTTSPLQNLQFWQFLDETQLRNATTDAIGAASELVLRGDQRPDRAAINAWLEQAKADFPMLQSTGPGSIETTQRDYRLAVLGDSVELIWLLLAVTMALLLIAAMNLTNLMLAHYQSRQQEFAVQLLTGCSVARLKALVALENLPMIAASLLIGVMGCMWLLRSLPLWASNSLPLLNTIGLHANIFAVFVLLGLLLLVLFSAPLPLPKNLAMALSGSGKGQVKQLRPVLVNSLFLLQLMLSTTIICASALLAYQSYLKIYGDLGFERVNSYLLSLSPRDNAANKDAKADNLTAAEQNASYQHYQTRNKLLAELISKQWPQAVISYSQHQPISYMVTFAKLTEPASDTSITSMQASVDNQYFAMFGIELLHGSLFSDQTANDQIIVDLEIAHLLSAADPAQAIGKRLNDRTVIGVVESIRGGIKLPTSYIVSKAAATEPQRLLVLLPDGQTLTESALQTALGELATEYPQQRIIGLQQAFQQQTQDRRMHLYLILTVSMTSLLLAVLGITGISQQQSRQQRYELAVRLATGASQQQLLWFSAKRSGLWLLLGLMTGAGLTWLILQYLSGYFSIIHTFRWQHLLVLQLLFMAVALSALLLPGWQVIRRDPMQSLRQP